ncbi:MAG: hypothetical protein ABI614_06855 [Planctomycetota bacterium]
MSSDVVACPQCGTNLQNSAGVAGQVVACPQCQTQLQMPPLSRPDPASPFPLPSSLPPALDLLPPSAHFGLAPDSGTPIAGPLVQTKRPRREAAASVADRLQKRSNPWVIVFAVALVFVLIVVGTIAYLGQQTGKARVLFEKQLVGNWVLIPGQPGPERWDFAFHADGHMQMALGTQLSEGHWRVASVRGSTGDVLIDWSDDTQQTLRVRLESGAIQVSLEGVGNVAFRAANG